jgi:drug/metabolite transporter (DMT)-like permease
MSLVLAGLSAVMFGAADFGGGFATKRAPAVTVVVLSQSVGLVLMGLIAPIAGAEAVVIGDFGWGAAAGIAGAIGLTALYQGLATTLMTVVAPATALVAVAVPVVFGLAIGERPSALALCGVVLAVPAMLLMNLTTREAGNPTTVDLRRHRRALGYALVAGASFGFGAVFITRTDTDAGLWPLLAARVATILILAFVAALERRSLKPPGTAVLPIVAVGVLDMAGGIFFLVAARGTFLVLAAVLTNLYPSVTIILAIVFLGERVTRAQITGLALTAIGVALIAGG